MESLIPVQKEKTVDKALITGITMFGGGSVRLENRLIKLPGKGFLSVTSDSLYVSETYCKSKETTKIQLTETLAILTDKHMDLLYQKEYNFTFKTLAGEKIDLYGPVVFYGIPELTIQGMNHISDVYNRKHDYLDVSKL